MAAMILRRILPDFTIDWIEDGRAFVRCLISDGYIGVNGYGLVHKKSVGYFRDPNMLWLGVQVLDMREAPPWRKL